MEWKHARTLADRDKIEREYGIRFTELLRLPYFDTARFSVVDPLHNILLGTPKRMITIWKDKGYLSKAQLEAVQQQCDKFVIPSDIGRIPHKISSGFASFTGDQWKNWTLIYSLVALRGILPHDDYNCWKSYVKACRLVCSKAISIDSVNQCDQNLAFCTRFRQLYGTELTCIFIAISRLTIVSREAKKSQRPLSELFTSNTAKKLANALAKLPRQLAPSYHSPNTFLLHRINKPTMVEIGATVLEYWLLQV